jgi:hypothetical protein
MGGMNVRGREDGKKKEGKRRLEEIGVNWRGMISER